MEASDVCVYLWFKDVTDEQRRTVLELLKARLLPTMTLSEQHERLCVRVETPSEIQAVSVVQDRVAPIRSELGLRDDQVTWGLDPRLLT